MINSFVIVTSHCFDFPTSHRHVLFVCYAFLKCYQIYSTSNWFSSYNFDSLNLWYQIRVRHDDKNVCPVTNHSYKTFPPTQWRHGRKSHRPIKIIPPSTVAMPYSSLMCIVLALVYCCYIYACILFHLNYSVVYISVVWAPTLQICQTFLHFL